jgi:hypothetical protein
MNNMLNNVKSFVRKNKLAVGSAVGACATAASAVPALCADGTSTLTASMFTDLTSQITADVGVLVPVGIGVMAIMVGVRLVPKIIYSFMS